MQRNMTAQPQNIQVRPFASEMVQAIIVARTLEFESFYDELFASIRKFPLIKQARPDYMRKILCRLVEFLASCGCWTVIMTAQDNVINLRGIPADQLADLAGVVNGIGAKKRLNGGAPNANPVGPEYFVDFWNMDLVDPDLSIAMFRNIERRIMNGRPAEPQDQSGSSRVSCR